MKILYQLGNEKSEISELYKVVQERKQELEFLKEHGSNNQLCLTLQKHKKEVQDVIKRVQNMTLSYKKASLKFEKKSEIDILELIGSIEEVREACGIQYSPLKFQQAQAKPVIIESMLTFKKVITEQLEYRLLLITDVAVTADNKLLLCNFRKGQDNIYVFNINEQNLTYNTTLSLCSDPYGISILTGTDIAVVTLPSKSYIQLINTKTLTLDETIETGTGCFSITTNGDYIAVGKIKEINIYKSNGENFRKVVVSHLLKDVRYISSLIYNHDDSSILYRKKGLINRIKLDGTLLHSYAVSGEAGIAVDAQGNVYVSECDKTEIQRVLSDGRGSDLVLTERESDGIESPFAVAFNENTTKFVVASITGLVQIYVCK